MSQAKTGFHKLPTRSEIIQEARQWLDTPYQHQAIVKHVGADCVGLIAGVGMNTGALDVTRDDLRSVWNYGRLPNPKRMDFLLSKYLLRVEDEPKLADIAWIQWREGMPMHLAILAEYKGRPTIIHSYGDVRKVTEHSLTSLWRDRIVSYWRYPNVI